MKKGFFLILLLPVFGWAQKKHTVGPKETLFSIGRLYKVHPRELAEYNKIPFETGLNIGQVLMIPSSTTMPPLAPVVVDQNTVIETKAPIKKEKTELQSVLIPVNHKVKKKESLYQISKQYKVSVADLKKWNKLSSDALSEGTQLIVGYSTKEKMPVKAVVVEPVVTIVKPIEPVVEKKLPTVIKEVEPATTVIPTGKEIDFNGGVFKGLFDTQTKNNEITTEDGMAGVFKSTSGWNDGKYYCLHNTVAAGTIIKITNATNGMSVYAKVLDVIPAIKQNDGLQIILSNAAAAELKLGEINFNAILNYSK